MSRATWYRHGKPATKPPRRKTQMDGVSFCGTSLRTFQRFERIYRLAPELKIAAQLGLMNKNVSFFEKMATGEIETEFTNWYLTAISQADNAVLKWNIKHSYIRWLLLTMKSAA
jgi:hypothetical protein